MGVVSDMNLQSSAMQLLTVGGVKTQEELESLMNLIIKSKKPTEDLTAATEGFTLLLANQSIMRLDNYGISSSVVRKRIIELMEANRGLSRSEAFKMATIEAATANVERYGDAADSASTALARLQIQAKNTGEDIGQAIAKGVEQAASALELLSQTAPVQQTLQSSDTNPFLAQKDYAYEHLRADPQLAGASDEFLKQVVQNAVYMAWHNPELVEEMRQGRTDLIETLISGAGEVPAGLESDSILGILGGSAVDLSRYYDQMQKGNAVAQETADLAAERADQEARTERILEQQASWQDKVHSQAQELLAAQRELAGQRSSMMGGMDSLVREGISTRGGEGNPNFLTASAAGEMRDLANEAGRLYDEMLKLDEANNAAFSDDQLERAKSQSEYLEGMADSADKAAEAFQNISLSELFGQEGGGTQGEMFDAIKRDLEDMQFTAEHIAGIQRTFDLASGRQTGASSFFEDTLSDTIAGVAANISQDLAVGMLEDFDSVMKEAVLRGMDTSQPQFLDKLNETFNTIDFDPEKFNVDEFLAEFDPAAQATTTMNTEAQGFADATSLAEGNMSRTETHVTNIGTAMADMTSKTHKLKIQPELVNIPNLIMMLVPALAQVVQANGGASPGTSQRDSQSGLVDRGRDR